MTPINTNVITFKTEVGNVDLFTTDNGWVFEFTSGWNNGLHCDVPFKTFDKCYTNIKSRMKEWILEQKNG
jgi:hypothetical protein